MFGMLLQHKYGMFLLSVVDSFRYTDDIPHLEGELYAGLILSTHAHAKITVDYSDAVKMEGMRGYVDVADVPGSNNIGNNNYAI